MMAHSMTKDGSAPAPGRPVVLKPAPPGLWMVLVGCGVAGLAPLFGFLVGSTVGPDFNAPLPPMYGGLMFGFILGGVGVLVAILGGRRMYLANRASGIDGSEPDPEDED